MNDKPQTTAQTPGEPSNDEMRRLLEKLKAVLSEREHEVMIYMASHRYDRSPM